MKRWKKAAAMGLAFMLAAVCSAGCGNSSVKTESTGTTAGASEESVSAQSDGTVDKVVWFSDVDFWSPPIKWNAEEGTVMGDITEATGLEFEMNIPAGDGSTKLALMIVNGSLPDIMSLTDSATIKELVSSGQVWKLEEFLQQYDPTSHLLNGGYAEDIKQLLIERDGDWYAYASHQNSPDNRKLYPPYSDYYEWKINYGENYGILWNDTALKEFGLTPEDLQTEEQVLAAFEMVKNSGKTVNGASYIPILVDGNMYQDATVRALEYFFGAMQIDDEGNYQDWIQAPESKHALEFLNTCVRKGYIDPNQFTIDTAGMQSYMASGRVLCFVGNKANTGAGMDKIGTTWTSTGAILSSEGTLPALPHNNEAGAGWIQTFISKDCSQPEKVAKWLSWMSSDEGMTLCVYGKEGVDYTLDEQGGYVETELGEEKKLDYTNTGLTAYWPFHNTDFFNHKDPAPEEGTEDYQGMLNDTALGRMEETTVYNSALLAFPDTLIDPSSDLGISKSQIDNYLKGQISTIVMAKDDASFEKEYEAMLNQLNKLGIEELNAAYNTAYQEKCEYYGETLTNCNKDRH